MKYLLLIVISVIVLSCRSSEDTSATSIIAGKSKGIVSHKYSNSGCKTVIFVLGKDNNIIQTLIPVNGLEKKFDKNNLKISFDFLPLKIKQPEGCNEGMPAEVSNVRKLKN